jgi:hypothetical protein
VHWNSVPTEPLAHLIRHYSHRGTRRPTPLLCTPALKVTTLNTLSTTPPFTQMISNHARTVAMVTCRRSRGAAPPPQQAPLATPHHAPTACCPAACAPTRNTKEDCRHTHTHRAAEPPRALGRVMRRVLLAAPTSHPRGSMQRMQAAAWSHRSLLPSTTLAGSCLTTPFPLFVHHHHHHHHHRHHLPLPLLGHRLLTALGLRVTRAHTHHWGCTAGRAKMWPCRSEGGRVGGTRCASIPRPAAGGELRSPRSALYTPGR